MICRKNCISLYSLNGAVLVYQIVGEGADNCILSCAFYEGLSNEWLERELLFTGHRRGLVNVSFRGCPAQSSLPPPYAFIGFLDLSASCLTYVQVWSKSIRCGRFELGLVRQLHHVDGSRTGGVNRSPGISCILPLSQAVYTGDESGRVVSYPLLPTFFISSIPDFSQRTQ